MEEILLNDKVAKLEKIIQNLEERIINIQKQIPEKIQEENQKNHPIGSIYVSFDSTSPAVLFGFGIWEPITDRFLYCSNNGGEIGGNPTHNHSTGNCTLTEAQIPSHSHQSFGPIQRNEVTFPDPDPYMYRNDHYDITIEEEGMAPQETGYTGGNQPHNHGNTDLASNMPPYITVYCWKRIQ